MPLQRISNTDIQTATTFAFSNTSISGNLAFTGAAQRITWNMSPASLSDRLFFQTNVTNGNSDLNIMPNGTGTGANFSAFTNTDVANSAIMRIGITSTSSFLNSFKVGTANSLPMAFQIGSTEYMRIAANGHVGIANTAPPAPLTITSSSTLSAGSPAIILQGESNTERLVVRSAAASGGTPVIGVFSARGTIASPTATQSGDPLAYYQMGGYDGTSYSRGAWILGYATENYSGTNRGSAIAFSTTPNGSITIAEAMRLDHTGNLGIGTTSPSYRLDVVAPGGSPNFIRYTSGTYQPGGFIANRDSLSGGAYSEFSFTQNGTSYGYLRNYGNIYGGSLDSSIALWNVQNSFMTFGTNNTERMRIDSAGNVGIGTSSPSSILDVNGTARASAGNFGSTSGDLFLSTINRVGQTAAPTVNCQNASKPLVISHDSAQPIIFGTSNTERMRIDSSGNVGIGITTPGSNLQINSTTSMGTGSATANILTVTNNNAVLSGVAGDKLGIVMSAMSDLSDRRVGLYCAAGNVSFNNPDFAIFQSGQGIAFRETFRITADATASLKFNSGYGSVATAYGCRAWLNYNAVTATIRGSGNVSSVVNNGTGDVSVIFATAMPDANFSWSISQQLNGTGNNDAGASSTARNIGTSAWAAGYVRILTMSNTNASQENPLVLTVAIFR